MAAIGMFCFSLFKKLYLRVGEKLEIALILPWLCDWFLFNSVITWPVLFLAHSVEKHSILLFNWIDDGLGLNSFPPYFFSKIYFIIVVYSYIEALREDPSGTSAGFSPPPTGGNQTPKVISVAVMLHDLRSQIRYEYFLCYWAKVRYDSRWTSIPFKGKGGRSSTAKAINIGKGARGVQFSP